MLPTDLKICIFLYENFECRADKCQDCRFFEREIFKCDHPQEECDKHINIHKGHCERCPSFPGVWCSLLKEIKKDNKPTCKKDDFVKYVIEEY